MIHRGTAIYSSEDLQHRIVVFTEADSLPIGEVGNGKSLADGDSRSTAASALRNLASDGYLSYDIVERDPETGQYGTRHIKKEGPTLPYHNHHQGYKRANGHQALGSSNERK
jgi:hypothetical protein